MTHPHLSRLATELLREEELRVAQSTPTQETLAIDGIERAIARGRSARRIRRVASVVSLALTAAVSLGVGWRVLSHRASAPDTVSAPTAAATQVAALGHPLSDGVVVVRDGRELAIGRGAALAPRDRVVTTATGRLAISFATGSHLVVGTSSDFAVTEQGMTLAFALDAGTLTADVAHLHAGERFLVRTLDAEIEVRGTSFEVRVVDPSPTCGAGARTRVVVSEGTVVVRVSGREDSIHKGESWPRDCAARDGDVGSIAQPPLTAATASAVAPALPDVALSRERSSAPAASALPAPRPAESDLGEQNALFAEASAARRRGDRATALATYDRFLAKHPGSQLAESASAERMRLLAASDPRRGAEAARAYLARYPHGFASAEATELTANGR
jgi:hypothetical protein